jgi:UDP-N-acetylglucosamine 2-epimerase (non-hydrolysing)
MYLHLIVGARPNFVKVAPLLPLLKEAGIRTDLVHTGQHYDALLSDIFFSDLEIPEPRWSLGVGSGTHAGQTSSAMMMLEDLFVAEKPDAVMVVGDVNSTLAGALAAAKLLLPVVHLEAGFRSGDMSMPEEINRVVTDQLSAMLLAPSPDALEHLSREGVDPQRVHFVGNIMAESVARNREAAAGRSSCEAFGLRPREYVVATVHRVENTDDPDALRAIVSGMGSLGMPVLFAVHPRTAERMRSLEFEMPGNVTVADPVGYLDMLSLQIDAAAVLTDSGGVQQEACMVHTPCVTVRKNTEHVATLEVGSNVLVSAEEAAILAAVRHAIDSPRDWRIPERWDTQVSERIADALVAGVVPLRGCAP